MSRKMIELKATLAAEVEAARRSIIEQCASLFDADIEAAAASAHEAYQAEAHRRGDVRHPDAYADLSEATKEWDRVLCRWAAVRIRNLKTIGVPYVPPEEREFPRKEGA